VSKNYQVTQSGHTLSEMEKCGCDLCRYIKNRRNIRRRNVEAWLGRWATHMKMAFFYFVMFQVFETLVNLIKRIL
jgi:hypothetical protein